MLFNFVFGFELDCVESLNFFTNFFSYMPAPAFGVVLMATLLGMALGGWLSGKIFDLTGSYAAAFANGMAWNALNVMIAGFLMLRTRTARPAMA